MVNARHEGDAEFQEVCFHKLGGREVEFVGILRSSDLRIGNKVTLKYVIPAPLSNDN